MTNSRIAVEVPEAAALVGLSESTVRREINAGKLPAHRLGRKILVRVVDLDAWVAALPAVS